MKKPSLTNKMLSIQIAWKELIHNSISSSLIIMVIAAIWFTIINSDFFKEGYLAILNENFYKSNQATRIDVLATNTKLEQQRLQTQKSLNMEKY